MSARGRAAPRPALIVSKLRGFASCCAGRDLLGTSRIIAARSAAEALRIVSGGGTSAVIVDLAFMDDGIDGLELALNLRDIDSSVPMWLARVSDRRRMVTFPLSRASGR